MQSVVDSLHGFSAMFEYESITLYQTQVSVLLRWYRYTVSVLVVPFGGATLKKLKSDQDKLAAFFRMFKNLFSATSWSLTI